MRITLEKEIGYKSKKGTRLEMAVREQKWVTLDGVCVCISFGMHSFACNPTSNFFQILCSIGMPRGSSSPKSLQYQA